MKKRAFTLIELMVVLAIIALLSALIFGSISSVREGSKRGNCQGNLNLIYAASRLYAQDNDGQFPYFNAGPANDTDSALVPGGVDRTPPKGLGLWGLYVYGPPPLTGSPDPVYGLPYSSNDVSTPNNPTVLASYLKAPRAFHCPSDIFYNQVTYNGGTPKMLPDAQLEFKGDDNRLHLNPNYLSYQGIDDRPNGYLYSSFRKSKATRQMRYFEQDPTRNTVILRDRRSPDQTIVTWCRFHRSLDVDGKTKESDFSRTFDNVLFLDGSVQSVPVKQIVTSINGQMATCQGWQRVPLAEANSVPNTLTSPSIAGAGNTPNPDFCG